MKHSVAIILLAVISVFFSSCLKDVELKKYTYYVPEYSLKTEVRADIKSSDPQPVSMPGRIYLQGNYIYVNEMGKGIHIIDYSQPSSPQNVGYIPIPGNGNMTIAGNYLYADEYADLLTIDITNPMNAKLVTVTPNVFPENNYGTNTDYLITNWRRVDTTIKSTEPIVTNPYPPYVYYDYYTLANSGQTPKAAAGTAGSMAQFTVLNNRLYTVSLHYLNVFNIEQPTNPAFVQAVNTNYSATETIFPFENNLFLGGGNGMFIYDASNADNPTLKGTFGHETACDPVIAEANTAYVTLHSGDMCGNLNNELDVLNTSDITNPVLINSYPFTNPRGLAKDGDNLFICDGADGLKIVNAADANHLTTTKVVSGFTANDVIVSNGIAIVTATEGLFLINYSDVANAAVVSKINIQ